MRQRFDDEQDTWAEDNASDRQHQRDRERNRGRQRNRQMHLTTHRQVVEDYDTPPTPSRRRRDQER